MSSQKIADSTGRRSFIGGSDARVIMGEDEAALLRLWREKRGEVEPEDLSDNLVVQLGSVTEDLNRHWYERNTSQVVTDVQRQVRHPVNRWMGATLDGMVEAPGRCSRPSSCCPGRSPRRRRPRSTWRSCSTTCGSPMPRTAVLSIITGGGKWVEITLPADRALPAPPDHGGDASSGAASRAASRRGCSASSRRGRASRRCGWST